MTHNIRDGVVESMARQLTVTGLPELRDNVIKVNVICILRCVIMIGKPNIAGL